MSDNNTDTPRISGTVNPDQLREFVDDRVAQHQPDPRQLAEAVAEFITHPEPDFPDELTSTQAQQVIALINEHAPQPSKGGGGGGGTGTGDLDPRLEQRIDETLRQLRVAGNPRHTRKILTGIPSGEYHDFGDWGQIVSVYEPVQWRSAIIDAETAGTTQIDVYEMDYAEGETYNLGDYHATREINHSAGPQQIYPEITLPPGQYFVTRNAEVVEPMRRIAEGVDFDALNADHEAPVRIECSWRAHAGYTPDNDVFKEKYKANGWDSNLYYFGDLEFGFMDGGITAAAAASPQTQSAQHADPDVEVGDDRDEEQG